MKAKYFLIIISFFYFTQNALPCNICGGGTNDMIVLALDGRALINLGFHYDHYLGTWDQKGVWREWNYTETQKRVTLSAAYRLNRSIQFAISCPFVFNNTDMPGVKSNGYGLGDITIVGRYEFFHEYQLKKSKGKTEIDNVLPYLAVTLGLTLPTGKSEETAENSVDITGKGYYTTSLGLSVTKSLIKNRLQLSSDISWQHSFSKTYNSYYGEPLTSSFTKKPGDKVNYSLSMNYIFSSEHAFVISASGFSQSNYSMNDAVYSNSNERNITFAAAYTYYPTLLFRITPSVKWNFPADDFGKNASGSTTFGVNLTYYFADYNIK